MKRLLVALCTSLSFAAYAQQNVLLEQSFWKNNPDVATVKAAVEKGADPTQFNSNSFDPVVLAINAGAPNETIKYLLAQPGNGVDKITHDSRIYLHWAASRGNIELMEYLVSKGSKADVIDSHGATPLNFAAGGGQTNTKVYDICIANGANLKKDLNQDGANALLLAVANDNDLTLTNYFTSKGLDLKSTDANGANAFSYAARAGNIEMLKKLLAKGVQANGTAMLMAAQGSRRGPNNIEVFQYLESLNLKPTVVGKNGENVLHSIARRPKQEEIIQYFLSKGVDVNQADEDGNTVFMNAAASNRDTATLNLLLPKVKNINQANAKGVTALMLAVRGNSPETVGYLIGKGASVNAADRNGDNLGYYLVQSYAPARAADFDAKLKVLEGKGYKVAEPQANGSTLYHLAVAKNDLSLVKRLEPYQIDVNAKNKEGLTALHKAAMVSKDDAILKYLLSVGAKKDIATNFQETAFDLASENESLSKNNVTVSFLK
ncbi:ankyrin repeat domain-containing protein [Dyadobacter sp. CY261]|uniref:ankyrin repeat domain-containing protein n=1 Tax=Dyadobacter sp. CY261 TaxID=2907203 RepID=UPI001F30F88F|nr:ankyrin repeat domain-containing protein [Dyadobacter sp. CY261]MCF0073015.1 ankyrin repeat domain-containing protein [Dyadobacter sp. CY261]